MMEHFPLFFFIGSVLNHQQPFHLRYVFRCFFHVVMDITSSFEHEQSMRKFPEKNKEEVNEEEEESKVRETSGLYRTGRLFGGLINDVKRKVPWYWSDYKDAMSIQCLAAFTFLYFACLTPLITFGGLLGDATENRLGTMESLCSGFLCGIVYGIFSGQPLTILGSTGPVLVFENILYDFCK